MSNRINFYPESWKDFFFRRIRDFRIATINTVDAIGTGTKSIVVLVIWVGNQKALFVFGKRIWVNKKAKEFSL